MLYEIVLSCVVFVLYAGCLKKYLKMMCCIFPRVERALVLLCYILSQVERALVSLCYIFRVRNALWYFVLNYFFVVIYLPCDLPVFISKLS